MKPPLLSWERIRMVLQEQDRLGQRDNMFRLEAIVQDQVDKMIGEGYKKVEEVELPKPYIPVDSDGNLDESFAMGARKQRQDILKLGKLYREVKK